MFSFFFSFYLAIEKKTSSFLVDLKLKTGSILNHERFDRIAEGMIWFDIFADRLIKMR